MESTYTCGLSCTLGNLPKIGKSETIEGIHRQKILYLHIKNYAVEESAAIEENQKLQAESANCNQNPHIVANSTYICGIH